MYSVKWIEENLGIERRTLRYYEEKELMSRVQRNFVNNFRIEYNEKDINKIWAIRTLMKMGFTTKEVKKIIYERGNNFYGLLYKKTEKLQKNLIETKKYYELAKTIKLTGKIPTVNDFGSIKFEDFIEYTYENFNFNNSEILSYAMEIDDKIKNNDISFLYDENMEKLETILKDRHLQVIVAYLTALSKMSVLQHTDKPVQDVVNLIYVEYNGLLEQEGLNNSTKDGFAKHFVGIFFGDGDIAKDNITIYGEKNCKFIADAITYFGEYESSNKI